jgi:hypothetical protein
MPEGDTKTGRTDVGGGNGENQADPIQADRMERH